MAVSGSEHFACKCHGWSQGPRLSLLPPLIQPCQVRGLLSPGPQREKAHNTSGYVALASSRSQKLSAFLSTEVLCHYLALLGFGDRDYPGTLSILYQQIRIRSRARDRIQVLLNGFISHRERREGSWELVGVSVLQQRALCPQPSHCELQAHLGDANFSFLPCCDPQASSRPMHLFHLQGRFNLTLEKMALESRLASFFILQ